MAIIFPVDVNTLDSTFILVGYAYGYITLGIRASVSLFKEAEIYVRWPLYSQ